MLLVNRTSHIKIKNLNKQNVLLFPQTLIERVFPWICICFGVPSNLVALVTILQIKMSTGTFYVALLAAADLANILVPSAFTLARSSHSDLVCKVSHDRYIRNI